eukprot:CAMPEP_0115413128 /NCGR_PEP_ID=MMETSP0271-20121206/21913_1 /TAXON_ID=71861 /ORGANISM="Scrippsiella trochoidea, Strain CCMP3099" /LENGTH=287 /DNA_ID=CAMNT_0002837403 /DNA_START=51 /DNA_END=914 /DNA_ORIENTATION=+
MGNIASPKTQGTSSSTLDDVSPAAMGSHSISMACKGQEVAKTRSPSRALPADASSLTLLDKPPPDLAKHALSRPPSDLSKLSSCSAGHSLDPTALKVVIVSCRGLRNADWMPGWGTSDPYCVCSIVGKRGQSFKTKVMQNTLNPIWNHHGELSGFAAGDTLEFKVFDQDFGKKDDFLGEVSLSSDAFLQDGFSGEVPLANAGKDVLPFLRIRVEASRGQAPLPLPPSALLQDELPPRPSALLEDEDMYEWGEPSICKPTFVEGMESLGPAFARGRQQMFWCCSALRG